MKYLRKGCPEEIKEKLGDGSSTSIVFRRLTHQLKQALLGNNSTVMKCGHETPTDLSLLGPFVKLSEEEIFFFFRNGVLH